MNNKGCCVSASIAPNSDSTVVSISGTHRDIALCAISLLAALLKSEFEYPELLAMCLAADDFNRDHGF